MPSTAIVHTWQMIAPYLGTSQVGDMLDQIAPPLALTPGPQSPPKTSYELTIDGQILKSPDSNTAALSPSAPVSVGVPSPFNKSSPFDAALATALSHVALVNSELQCAIACSDSQKSNLYAAAQLRKELTNAVALLDQLESGDHAVSTRNFLSPSATAPNSLNVQRVDGTTSVKTGTPDRRIDRVGERALAAARERQFQRSKSMQRSPSIH